jgi:hypothetical protein
MDLMKTQHIDKFFFDAHQVKKKALKFTMIQFLKQHVQIWESQGFNHFCDIITEL